MPFWQIPSAPFFKFRMSEYKQFSGLVTLKFDLRPPRLTGLEHNEAIVNGKGKSHILLFQEPSLL